MKPVLTSTLCLLLLSCTSESPSTVGPASEADETTVRTESAPHDPEAAVSSSDATNHPPQISQAKMMLETFKPGDALGVEVVASDPDQDAVTLQYEWTKNGDPAGNGQRIDAPLKRGDNVSVRITPFDGADHGATLVLDREIVNQPPMVNEHEQYQFDGAVYTYQLNATDFDGDALTYALHSGPAGMRIDSSTGVITWNVPPEFIGKAIYRIAVTDGHGGKTEQDFTFSVNPPSSDSPSTPK